MKHLKVVSKAQTSTDIGDVLSMVMAVLQALVPIISWIIDSKTPTTE